MSAAGPPKIECAPRAPRGSRCPYCHTEAGGEPIEWVCGGCGAWSHEACVAEGEVCAACGGALRRVERVESAWLGLVWAGGSVGVGAVALAAGLPVGALWMLFGALFATKLLEVEGR